MKKRRIIRLIVVVAMVILGVSFTVAKQIRFLMSADYFKIKEIISNDSNPVDLSDLRGENIFAVNLRQASEYITQQYPYYRRVRLVRILPNRIFVDFIKRKAMGLIKLYRYFCVDEEGVLFDTPEQLTSGQDLPVILGLETKIFGPKLGKRYNIEELRLALNLIKELKSNRVLKDYGISKVNVVSLATVSFFIRKGATEIEVKLGNAAIKDKIAILASLFRQGEADLVNIRYIDLRFKEPVIRFNDAK